MKQGSIITSVESRITVPQLSMSNFYSNPLEESSEQKKKKSNNKFSSYFEEIDWSSATSKADCFVEITCVKSDNYDDNYDVEYLTVPVMTSFIFTCTKGNDEYYEITWLTSLS